MEIPVKALKAAEHIVLPRRVWQRFASRCSPGKKRMPSLSCAGCWSAIDVDPRILRGMLLNKSRSADLFSSAGHHVVGLSNTASPRKPNHHVNQNKDCLEPIKLLPRRRNLADQGQNSDGFEHTRGQSAPCVLPWPSSASNEPRIGERVCPWRTP